MPFTTQYITSINPPEYVGGGLMRLSWTCDAPAGMFTQLYINNSLVWWDLASVTSTDVPAPSSGVTDRIVLGNCNPGEEEISFAADLPVSPARRAELSWYGGLWEGTDLASFRVYGSPSPGAPIDYGHPLATIAAYPQGITAVAGWGMGPFGIGGFGYCSSLYTWTSGTLANGTWQFAIVPMDTAGNQGAIRTTAIDISAPPTEPGAFSDGSRLHYQILAYGQTQFGVGGYGWPEVELTWNPSSG